VLHGVTPATWPLFQPLLQQVDAQGGIPANILVSPASHPKESLADDLPFCAAMDGRLLRGDELVLNGYGPRPGNRGEGGAGSPRTGSGGQAGEATQPPLSEREARGRLRAGLHQFIELDWPVPGFVAPGWRLGDAVRAALDYLPFHYTADRERLIRLDDGWFLPTPAAVGSDLGAPWTTALSTQRRSSLPEYVHEALCLRLVVHPMDMQHPDGRNFWLRKLDHMIAERRPLTLSDWLDRAETPAG